MGIHEDRKTAYTCTELFRVFLMPFAKEHLVATCVLHVDEVSLQTARAVKW